MHFIARRKCFIILLTAVVVLVGYPAAQRAQDVTYMDYRDYREGVKSMAKHALGSPQVAIYSIGPSTDPELQTYALKISGSEVRRDDGSRNAVLFECGMHAREWFSAESCYLLADYLVKRLDRPGVQDLLANVDVWILPQSNPSGRMIDDRREGSPQHFARVCKGGPRAGEPCRRDFRCRPGTCYQSGWRTNANTEDCYHGVDLARNFSRDWTNAARCDDEKFMKFRGRRPFSEVESRNLRRFVNNHMISQAVVIHTFGQKIAALWPSSAPNRFVRNQLVAQANAATVRNPELRMSADNFGQTSGQFSAWLSRESDTPGSADLGTRRHITTYYLELPVRAPVYRGDEGDGRFGRLPYRAFGDDRSNAFHPSGTVMPSVFRSVVLPLYLELIRQARSPQCPVDRNGARLPATCGARNFTLVGAKIAPSVDVPGDLDYDASDGREILKAGPREIVYAIQNSGTFGTDAFIEIDVRRTGLPGPVCSLPSSTPINIPQGARVMRSFSCDFSVPGSYTVEIALTADAYAADDRKVFRFDVVN